MLQCLDVESCLDLAEKGVFCLLKKVPSKELVQSISVDMLDDTYVERFECNIVNSFM